MNEKLRRLWRDYNLSLVLLACFLASWVLQAWTGWRKFAAEQLQHQQAPSVFGDDGYIWEFLAATFKNWQSEFLQLLAMVVHVVPDSSRQRRVEGQQRLHGSQAR